jgi:pimeloyl-ACP methyl ester carboxylesterase
MTSLENVTIILAHGAWADGSSWSAVIGPLTQKGLRVFAAPLPLSSLSDDAAALRRTLARTEGPVVVAGHAYAGAAIATLHDERVRGLVYIAALAPAKGETVAEVFYREEAHSMAPELAPDEDGWIWMPEESFSKAFAHHATADQIALLRAVQRPISVKCIQEAAPEPAWSSKPSWFLIAEEDRMINPKTQQFMADRMRAQTRSFAVDHTPLVTAPEPVVQIILAAAQSA